MNPPRILAHSAIPGTNPEIKTCPCPFQYPAFLNLSVLELCGGMKESRRYMSYHLISRVILSRRWRHASKSLSVFSVAMALKVVC